MIVEISVTERIDRTLQNDRKRASRSGICCRRHTCGSASRSARSHGTRRPCSSQRARDRRIHRYYDPATGQLLNVDPLVNQTNAAYVYALDNPVNGSDPTGLSTCGQPSSPWDIVGSVIDCVSKGNVGGAVGTIATGGLRTVGSVVANTPAGMALSAISQVTGVSVGGCVGGSLFAGVDGTGSICYYATPSGQSGITLGGGGGGGGPFGGNFLIGPSISNAQTLSDFGGGFGFAGGSAGEGIYGAGAQGQIGQNSCGRTIWSATIGWAPGLRTPAPFSFEGGGTYTWTYPQW